MLPLLGIGSRVTGLGPHQCHQPPRLRVAGAASQLAIVLLKPPGQIRGDTHVERMISALQKVDLPQRVLS